MSSSATSTATDTATTTTATKKRGRKCLTEEVKQQRLVEKTREKAAIAAAKALKATQPSSKEAKK